MSGKWFDELEVGQVFKHALRRTLTETDNLLFTTMTHNPAQLHLDAEYCKNETEFGGVLINSMFTMGLVCLLYTSPSPRDATLSRMPSSA